MGQRDESTRVGCLAPLGLLAALAIGFSRRGQRSLNLNTHCPRCEAAKHLESCKHAHDKKPVEEILRQVMLELLYPAVLGAVLFEGLKLAGHVFASIDLGALGQLVLDGPMALKCALVALTVLFYGCDYVYIILTRRFRIGFFGYDCLFLVGLYITFTAMNVDEAHLEVLPITWAVAWLYASFSAGYLAWDYSESKDSTLTHREKNFYAWVLIWEVLSYCAFSAISALATFSSISPLTLAQALTTTLFCVTVLFGVVIIGKHEFSAA